MYIYVFHWVCIFTYNNTDTTVPFHSFQLLYCSRSAPPTSAQQLHLWVPSTARMSSEKDFAVGFADAIQQAHPRP